MKLVDQNKNVMLLIQSYYQANNFDAIKGVIEYCLATDQHPSLLMSLEIMTKSFLYGGEREDIKECVMKLHEKNDELHSKWKDSSNKK